MDLRLAFVVSLLLCFAGTEAREPSVCYGTTANGRLEHGWKLPASGANFQSYSTMGRVLGRTYVHSWVHSVVLGAYSELENSQPPSLSMGKRGRKKVANSSRTRPTETACP